MRPRKLLVAHLKVTNSIIGVAIVLFITVLVLFTMFSAAGMKLRLLH
jgi:hypothetical protein